MFVCVCVCVYVSVSVCVCVSLGAVPLGAELLGLGAHSEGLCLRDTLRIANAQRFHFMHFMHFISLSLALDTHSHTHARAHTHTHTLTDMQTATLRDLPHT